MTRATSRMPERRVVQASTAFTVTLRGAPFTVGHGDRFWSDDPLVLSHPGEFRELTVRSSQPERAPTADVETASADPGTARRITRRRTTQEETADA